MILKRILYLLLEILMIAFWVPVGLFFWIPFLIRSIGGFTGAFTIAALSGNNEILERGEYQLNQAVSFWADGFVRIRKSLDATRTATSPPSPSQGSGAGAIVNALVQVVIASVIWYVTLRLFSSFIPGLKPVVQNINETIMAWWDVLRAGGR